jgi:hypothetical protein
MAISTSASSVRLVFKRLLRAMASGLLWVDAVDSIMLKHYIKLICRPSEDSCCALRFAPASRFYASKTAMIPERKTPSKVPAPPIEAIGAPTCLITPRFVKSAPMRVPSTPHT